MRPSCANHRSRLGSMAVLVALLGIGAPRPAQPGTEALPVSPLDVEYDFLREMTRRGQYPQLAASRAAKFPLSGNRLEDPLGTWTQGPRETPLGVWFRPYLTLIGLATDPERQLRPLFLDVREGDVVDPLLRLRAGTYLDARFHEAITAHIRFAFDSEGANETLNRTRDFQQLEASNNFDEAYLRVSLGPANVHLGRMAQRWGPERLGSLTLGSTSPAPDMVHGSLAWGPHHLQAFVGQLSAETDTTGTYRRWLYGHRADLYFFDGDLRLGISELAVVAGRSESVDLRYLNPISLWAQVQVEDDESDATEVNILNAVDAEYRLHTTRLYGTLVVDDFQVDAEGREEDPDQLAWCTGIDWSPTEDSDWLLGYEYRRIGSWTYLRRNPGTDFRQFRRPLAAPQGPDTDRHNLRVDWRPRPQTRFWLETERRRRGVNRLRTEESRLGQAGRPFPLGPVEKRWVVAGGATWSHAPLAHLSVELAYHAISNVNNQPGTDEDVLEFRALVHLRSPSWGWTVAP